MTAKRLPKSLPIRTFLTPRRGIVLVAIAAIAIMIGSGGTAMQQLAFQATPSPTPTTEELEELRAEAISDEVDQLELEFEEFNDSGIEGTATFYDLDTETLVAVEIEGGGEEHPAFILEGICSNTEPEPTERLTSVNEDGTSLSLIESTMAELLDDGDYVIDLRLSPADLGVLIACANIEGELTPATPSPEGTSTPESETPTAVPTGEGGIDSTPTPEATATATTAPTSTPEPTATTPGGTDDGTGGPEAGPGSVATLPLDDYSDLGVTGDLTMTAIDGQTTRVLIKLSGDAVTGGHVAHLHPGTCANPSDDGTIYLASVNANGVSETTVRVPLADLLTDGWIVNVHPSEANWDAWMVCGSLSDATISVGGTDDTSTTVQPTPTPVTSVSDGTSGTNGVVSGKGSRTTTTLTQGVGVGSAIPWPESPVQSVAIALGIFALILSGAALILRAGHRANGQPTRWQRLGL